MRLLIDDQIFLRQARGGVSRYFVELMKQYRQEGCGVDVIQPWRWSNNVHAEVAGFSRPLPLGSAKAGILSRIANRRRFRPSMADVVHHTYYDTRYLRRYPGVPRAVTIYDMIPELFPDMFPGGNPHGRKREFVAAADLVLCISHSTKQDLIEVFGPQSAPVVVTPLGVDSSFKPGLSRLPLLPKDYALFVGNRRGYKDFDVLVDALAAVDPAIAPYLVAIGGGPFNEEDQNRLRGAGIFDRAVQVTLTDHELPRAYANAVCFVFPSRYEGFGLPTLEAMASGCPAILANTSSHLEVGGHAARYFEAGDSDALSRQLTAVTSDTAVRETASRDGLVHAKGFTWEATAQLTLDAYRAALGAA